MSVWVPVMLQRWHEISFFHWPCEAAILQKRLPPQLRIDKFDGTAWISLTPFFLKGLRPPLVPEALGLDFPETNLRTYVQGPSGPGIWFFSLDAASCRAVIGARTTIGLPYRLAKMNVRITDTTNTYSSNRRGRAAVSITVEKGAPLAVKSPLDVFLTERYRLYAVHLSTLLTVEVSHPSWVLNAARIVEFSEGLRAAASLPAGDAPLLSHHSTGVDARIGLPIPIARTRNRCE
jgi:uncharacterized protein YqjF (DUF2071 family)